MYFRNSIPQLHKKPHGSLPNSIIGLNSNLFNQPSSYHRHIFLTVFKDYPTVYNKEDKR